MVKFSEDERGRRDKQRPNRSCPVSSDVAGTRRRLPRVFVWGYQGWD